MDQTKRPLRIPPEYAMYAEENELFSLFERMVQDLIVTQPNDPLDHLINFLHRANDNVPQIVVLGPPASGKASIATIISQESGIVKIDIKCLLDQKVEAVDRAIESLGRGEDIPGITLASLMKERVSKKDCVDRGWMLVGYPKTREQALALQREGIFAKHVVLLEAPDTVLVERFLGKRVDSKTGDIYHVTFEPPESPDVTRRLVGVDNQTEKSIRKLLLHYHRHLLGIKQAYAHGSVKVINADQPKSDVYAQVQHFLCQLPRSVAPHCPRVILMGARGSGKTTQATLLAAKYGLVNISMVELIKQAIADKTKVGEMMMTYIEKKIMVPDNIVLKCLVERLSRLDCATKGWVLRGYPRTRNQAETLTEAGYAPNRIYFLDCPSDTVIERLSLRRVDPVTGQQCHLIYNPPPSLEMKRRLRTHPKDEEDQIDEDILGYETSSEEIQEYYGLGQIINADQDPHTVFESIESLLVKPLPRQTLKTVV